MRSNPAPASALHAVDRNLEISQDSCQIEVPTRVEGKLDGADRATTPHEIRNQVRVRLDVRAQEVLPVLYFLKPHLKFQGNC